MAEATGITDVVSGSGAEPTLPKIVVGSIVVFSDSKRPKQLVVDEIRPVSNDGKVAWEVSFAKLGGYVHKAGWHSESLLAEVGKLASCDRFLKPGAKLKAGSCNYEVLAVANRTRAVRLYARDICSGAIYYFSEEGQSKAVASRIRKIMENARRPTDIHEIGYSSPKMLANELRKVILGQDQVLDRISVTAFDHLANGSFLGKPRNTILVGRTGCGKTLIAMNLVDRMPVPVLPIRLAGLTGSGYKGPNMLEQFEQQVKAKEGEDLERAIVVLDEIDKLCPTEIASSNSTGMTSYHSGVESFGPTLQQELISIIEGAMQFTNRVPLDTRRMLFIATGAFVRLKDIIAKRMGIDKDTVPEKEILKNVTDEDLIAYGLMPELVGRMPNILFVNPLGKEDLMRILRNERISPIRYHEELLRSHEYHNTRVELEDGIYEVIVEAAMRKQIGARALDDLAAALFEKIKFDVMEYRQDSDTIRINTEMAIKLMGRHLHEGPAQKRRIGFDTGANRAPAKLPA